MNSITIYKLATKLNTDLVIRYWGCPVPISWRAKLMNVSGSNNIDTLERIYLEGYGSDPNQALVSLIAQINRPKVSYFIVGKRRKKEVIISNALVTLYNE